MRISKVTVLMHSGIRPFKRDILSVFYWDGVRPITEDATPDLVAKLLIQSNHEKSNAIVTAKGKLYLSFDTPGYCDGENTVIKMV